MKFLYVLAVVLVAVASQDQDVDQDFSTTPRYYSYPEWYIERRQRRDITIDQKTKNGRVFGTLGQTGSDVFGKAGYEHNFFDDHRGTLKGQVHGTRVLSPNGHSSIVGGNLNWKNPNAAASLDVNKRIGGQTSYQVGGGGRWQLGKNSDVSVQGTYGNTFGGRRPQYGASAMFNYRW